MPSENRFMVTQVPKSKKVARFLKGTACVDLPYWGKKEQSTAEILQWNPQGSRGRGRPRETWRRCMEREMKDVGMTWVALSKKAQDRDVWRRFCLWPIS